jgi:hypothetical protein
MKRNLKKKVKIPQECLLKKNKKRNKKLLIQTVKIQMRKTKMRCRMLKIQMLLEFQNIKSELAS